MSPILLLSDIPSKIASFVSLQNVAFLLGLVGVSVTYKLVIYPRYLSPMRHIPSPYGRWMWGDGKVITTDEPGTPFMEWGKARGPIVRFSGPLGNEMLSIMSPEPLHQILVNDWTDNPRPSFLKNLFGTVAGFGLLTTTGDVHRRMRKAMNPAFSLTNLTTHIETFYQVSDRLVAAIGKNVDKAPPSEGAVFPAYWLVAKATLDMISLSAFGYETNSLDNSDNELASAYEAVAALQNGRVLLLFIVTLSIPGVAAYINSEFGYRTRALLRFVPFGGAYIRLMEIMRRIRAISRQIMNEKIAEAAQFGLSEVKGKRDIMSILIREREAERAQSGSGQVAMTDAAMMDQVLTFLGAGHDTTASTITWTLWLLANDLKSQQQLREEVTILFEKNPRPEYRDLKELPCLDGVIMESMRLMPAAPITQRDTTKPMVIEGHAIPAGTQIIIPIRAINTNKKVWGPDAEEFRPSRWSNLPPEVQKNLSMNFFSFFIGPHACIGKTMAIMETKVAIAKLIAAFVFEPTHAGQKAKPVGALTMKPADGMPLRVRRVV